MDLVINLVPVDVLFPAPRTELGYLIRRGVQELDGMMRQTGVVWACERAIRARPRWYA